MLSSLLSLALAVPVASAADTDIQALRPATPGGPLTWTEGAGVARGPTGSIVLQHASGLLIQRFPDGTEQKIVAGLTRADLLGGFGLGRLHLGLGLPVLLRANSDTLPDQTGLGDLTVNARLALLQPADHPLGLGLVGRLSLPTTTVDAPLGGGGVGFEGRAVAETGTDDLRLLLNLGLRLQAEGLDTDLPSGSSLVSGAGVAWALSPKGGLTGELALAPVLGASDLANTLPAELLGGGWLNLNPRWRLNLGAGVGLGDGVGTPAWRVYAALAPRSDRGIPEDVDQDSVPNDRDLCPYEAETVNGIRDDDGCPEDPSVLSSESDGEALALASEADADGDGILDRLDLCPQQPEDMDGLMDEDGCPDTDVDEDGVPDAQDRCPLAAETLNGVDDADGCPEAIEKQVEEVAGVVRDITFRTGKDSLQPSSEAVLRKVLAVLKDHPGWTVRIVGHTDTTGERDVNLDLSARRADTVMRWLKARGIDAARMAAAGEGPDRPLASNDTEEGRALNRRVEISYSSQETP